MALSTASYIILIKDLATGRDVATEVPLENYEIHIPKQTAIDKIGGILCYICDSIFGNKKDFEHHYSTHNTLDVVYTCVACKKQLSGYPSFRNHCYIQHIVKDKFPCQQCTKSFSKQTALNAHITNIHNFKCIECDEKFKTKKDLQMHKIIHNKKQMDSPPFNCYKCQQVLPSIDKCESHLNDHCEVLYPCPICADLFPDKKTATLHLMNHFDEKVTSEMGSESKSIEDSSIGTLGGILCCHCDQLFKTRGEIDSHFASEHEDKVIVYSCNICEKQYTKYSLFGDHCYFHFTKDKFQCDQCNRLFPRLPLLVMHTLTFHSPEAAGDRPFQCDKCIYGFKSHYRLVEHKRIVHDDHKVKCQLPDCTATFNTPTELITHQREHASRLGNWCRQCGLQFPTLAACERHLDMHRRTQYACPVCARTYRERYFVLKHLPKHFESVLHICKVCGRSYSARNRLMEHAKTHSEEKKFKCAHCSKTFLRPYERVQHERIHAGHQPYRCTVCPKTFASYPNWTKHLSRAHAYDKTMIKQVREAYNTEAKSPNKTESGIESAGSEVSDLYPFDSDDDAPTKKIKRENETKAKLSETVSAAIDRIDEDLDLFISQDRIPDTFEMKPLTPVPTDSTAEAAATAHADIETTSAVLPDAAFDAEFDEVDDSSDIKAIVEHIDALSGGIEMPEDDMQFAEMVPVENVYSAAPVYTEVQPPLSYPPAEYGPDFHTLSSEAFHTLNTEAYHVDSEHLPHIDPNLTIKEQKPSKLYVQNVQRYEQPVYNQGWEPIITKMSYSDPNDSRMYVLNGNIF